MRTPAAAQLLDLFDAGQAATPTERALMLLHAAGAAAAQEQSLGQINARLFELRGLIFGRAIECLADCPACGAIVETEVDCNAMSAEGTPGARTCIVEHAGEAIPVRLPTAADLVALADMADAGGNDLVQRIAQLPAHVAPHEVADEIADAIARLDPLAHIELLMRCPGCGHEWAEPLHVGDVLWREIGALAVATIHDVARLAQAFGWGEAEVLAMTPRRRRRYLDLLPA